jgi:uncharacterized protein YqhQ
MMSSSSAADDRTLYGGQAVVEGVMMRSPRYYAVACRRLSNDEIVIKVEDVNGRMRNLQWLNKPFLRGTLAMVDAMAMGIRALTYAANIQAADEKLAATSSFNSTADEAAVEMAEAQPINNITIGIVLIVSLAIGYSFFWVLPTLITQAIQSLLHITKLSWQQILGVNLFEGFIRICFFLGYVLLISRMPHVQRVFQYHGAEHKAINTLEAGQDLTVLNARKASRIHPRCGTNFIFIVLIVAMLVFSLFGRPAPYIRIPLHLLLLPVVAGISFEILKFAGAHRDKKWAQWMIAPGLATQYLTTRVPDDSQLEVALSSLKAVWNKEHAEPEDIAETLEPAATVA